MKIFKRISIFLGVFFLIIVILVFASFLFVKNLKISDLVESEIEKELGINVTIRKLEFSPLLAHIGVSGITIHNPPGFGEDELAYISSLHLTFDPVEMITRKKPNIYLLTLDLTRLNILQNKEGKVNIKELVPIKEANASMDDKTPFYFDVLVLSVGDVRYTTAGKKTRKYHIGMKDQVFFNLQDEGQVIKLVIFKAIQNTDIGKLINLKIVPVVSQIKDVADSAWGTAKTGAKGAWAIAALPFNLLFGRN